MGDKVLRKAVMNLLREEYNSVQASASSIDSFLFLSKLEKSNQHVRQIMKYKSISVWTYNFFETRRILVFSSI